MVGFSKVQVVCALFLASACHVAYGSTMDCASNQDAAAKAAVAQAIRGDDGAKLRAAVFTKDAAAFDSALAKLRGRSDPSSRNAMKQALSGAAWTGNMSALSALLAEGVDPGATTTMTAAPPLVLASECGEVDAMVALVAKGARVNDGAMPDRVDTVPHGALEAAIVSGQPASAAWLLDNGYEVCQTREKDRIDALLARPDLSAALPASLKARLACQASSTK